MKFSTNHAGAIAESAITLDLLKKGHNVMVPLRISRYDRLVETSSGDFYRLQIKTARIDQRDGNLRVTFEGYSHDEIDLYGVVAPDGDVYYVPVKAVPETAKGFTIRLTPRKNTRKTRSLPASEYKCFPPKGVRLNALPV